MVWPTEKLKLWALIAFNATLAGLFFAAVVKETAKKDAKLAAERLAACGELGLQAATLDRCAASPEDLAAAKNEAERQQASREFPAAIRAIADAVHPLLAPFDSGHLARGRRLYAPLEVSSWCKARTWGAEAVFDRGLIGRPVTFSAALFVHSVWSSSGDELVGYDVSISPARPGGADYSCPASISQLPPEQRKALRQPNLCEPCGINAWGTLRLLEASFWEQDTFTLGVDIEGLDVWRPSQTETSPATDTTPLPPGLRLR